jgi:hypothetical protein
MLEYAYNDSEQPSTGATPFYLNTSGPPANPLTRAIAAESITCQPRTTSSCTSRRPSRHRQSLCPSSAAAPRAAPAMQVSSLGTETGPWAPQGGGRAPRLLDVVHHDALREAQESSAPLQRCCSAAMSLQWGYGPLEKAARWLNVKSSGLPHIMRLSSMGRRTPSLRPLSSAGPPPWRAPPGAPCTTPSASSAAACARAPALRAQHAHRQQAGALTS